MSTTSTTTGSRISELLDGIDFNDRTLWQGGIKPDGTRLTGALDGGDAITAANVAGDKSALALIQDLLEAERGVFYISKDGRASFEERGSRARRTTSTATITTYALTSQPGFEFDQLVNRQAVTRTGGTTQIAQNPISVKLYGVCDGSEIQSGYVATDTQALNLAQFIVNVRSSFVAPVTVEMDGGSPDAIVQMLTLELQDRVTVNDTSAGTSGDYIVEGIETEIKDGGNGLRVTFTLSEYGVEPFIIGSDTQGIFAPPDGTVSYNECTNASRPSSPAANSFIYETDTGRYFKYVGSAWVEQIYPRLTY